MEQPEKVKEVIRAALHGDKEIVLTQQHLSIEQQIAERERIDKENLLKVAADLAAVHNEVLALTPDEMAARAGPEARRDMINLVKEEIGLSKEMRAETRDTWKDIQLLKTEERIVEKELTQVEQRKKRYDELL
jgi:hypothetical protein